MPSDISRAFRGTVFWGLRRAPGDSARGRQAQGGDVCTCNRGPDHGGEGVHQDRFPPGFPRLFRFQCWRSDSKGDFHFRLAQGWSFNPFSAL